MLWRSRGLVDCPAVGEERVAEGDGAQGYLVGKVDHPALLAVPAKFVDESWMLGKQGVKDDVERALEDEDGCELRRSSKVGDARVGRLGRSATSHADRFFGV